MDLGQTVAGISWVGVGALLVTLYAIVCRGLPDPRESQPAVDLRLALPAHPRPARGDRHLRPVRSRPPRVQPRPRPEISRPGFDAGRTIGGSPRSAAGQARRSRRTSRRVRADCDHAVGDGAVAAHLRQRGRGPAGRTREVSAPARRHSRRHRLHSLALLRVGVRQLHRGSRGPSRRQGRSRA